MKKIFTLRRISLSVFMLTLFNISSAQTTVKVTLNAASDDMEEFTNTNELDEGSSDIELVVERNHQIVGLRFNNINIPKGAKITNAYIQFTADESSAGQCDLTFKCENADNPGTFTDLNKVSMRTLTVDSVNWNNVPAWLTSELAGPNQRTPDLSAIIKSVINRSTWAEGNSIVFVISGSGVRVADAYEKSAVFQTEPTYLFIEYDGLGSGINSVTADDFRIFPNPSNQFLNIDSKEDILSYSIYNMMGTLVADQHLSEKRIDISQLPIGPYTIKIESANAVSVKRFIRN